MSAAELEAPRALRKPGDTDAVTFSWVDADAGLCGLARVAAGMGVDGETSTSGLAVGFLGRQTLGAIVSSPAEDLVATTEEPLARWTVRGTGELTFELEFEALFPPVSYSGRQALVKAGGMEGYEQLCRVSGTVEGRSVSGLGQRGHAWGNPDWDKIALTRSVSVWFEDGGVALGLVRSTKTSNHADEAAWGASFSADGAIEVDEVRLSTTTDDEGRQIRAGLEVYPDKDTEYPYRGTGEVLTGSTLELGALRMDVAFFRWHVEGRTGVGRYDLIRRGMIKAVISDFGGVITLPLNQAFARAHEEMGVPLTALGDAMKLAASRSDEPPLFKLERGQLTDPEFMAIMQSAISEVVGRAVVLDNYGDRLMRELRANEPLLAYYGGLKARGVRLAILTNNVREWQPRWMPLLPDGMFELIVDSGFEGVRKPEPEIYGLTLSRLGLDAGDCAFVDDVEINVAAANALGLHGIHFRTTEQVVAELDQLVL